MTEPIKTVCGNYYVGMNKNSININECNSKELIFNFNKIDKDSDGVLSEQEIIKAREISYGEKARNASLIKTLAVTSGIGGLAALKVAMLATTAPAWLPYAGVALLVGGVGAWFTGIVKEKKAEDIKDETLQYIEQNQSNINKKEAENTNESQKTAI